MADQLVNEFTVNRPIDEAWAVITDVERIAPCLPGAQLQEIEGDTYRGVVKIKLGSITPQFKGEANFVERDDTAHRAVLKAQGRDTGGRGNAAAEIEASAESLSPTSTRVVVTTDLHITGKVAQFGRGIIGDVSKKLMAQFAGNLNSMLDEPAADEPGPDEPAPDEHGGDEPDATTTATTASTTSQTTAATEPVAVEPAATDVEAPSGNGDDAASALGADVPRAADQGPAAAPIAETAPPLSAPGAAASVSSPPPPPPKVRKIDSPASEPVDLAGVAGPAILKRVAPVIGVALIVVLFVRRRRR